mgnify:CR=1 FL=1
MPATAEPTGNHPSPNQLEAEPQRSRVESAVLPAEDFDALARRLDQPGRFDPQVARVLSRKAPWD